MIRNVILMFALFLGATACSTLRTSFDYDQSVDFTKYKTYKIMDEGMGEVIGELSAKRIIEAVDSEMKTRGMTASESPDVIVDLRVKTQEMVEANATTTNTGRGYGYYGYGPGYSTTQVTYNQYTDGTLIITIAEKTSNNVVWQGIGVKTVEDYASPERRDQIVKEIVQKVMVNYPPQVKE